MKCPKCEEGTLIRIYFKKRGEEGIQCEFCGTVWLEEESVRENTGHPIQTLTNDGDTEYTFTDTEKDETKPARYPVFK